MMYWQDDHGMNGWGLGLMAIGLLLLLALLAVGVIALWRYSGAAPHQHAVPPPAGPAGPGGPPVAPGSVRPSPEQILAERLATGEIDPEEYRHRLEALRAGQAPAG
jgi:putative membrane protein